MQTGGYFFMDEHELIALGAGGSGRIRCISIIGQIEGHQSYGDGTKTTKYEHLLPLLAEAEASPEVGGVLFLLNTAGGDVDAGLAIAELIAGMKTPTASIVLGGGHSIGVPLAVAARRSFIAPSAALTLHPVRLTGVVLGAPQTYRYLGLIQDRVVGFVTAHSRISRERLLELMLASDTLTTDLGSIVTGGEAVDCGLIDAVGSLSEALAFLRGAAG